MADTRITKAKCYQKYLVLSLNQDTSRKILIVYPTGSGKTLMLLAHISACLERKFSHVVIACPQQQIADGFANPAYSTFYIDNVGLELRDGTKSIIRPLYGDERPSAQTIRMNESLVSYINSRDPRCGQVCTYKTLQGLLEPSVLADLPADLSQLKLIIDEAHHVPADILCKVVEEFERRGAQIILVTATPFRYDLQAVYNKSTCKVYMRSLSRHMQEGECPRHIDAIFVGVPLGGDSANAFDELESDDSETPKVAVNTSGLQRLVDQIVTQWELDGRHKTIVRVPGNRIGSHTVKLLYEAFDKVAPGRVLNAAGKTTTDKKRVIDALSYERNCESFNDSKYDVIVAIHRATEGSDWKFCSDVVFIGIPSSIGTVIQGVGRATRYKKWILDYPEARKDAVQIRFYVPHPEDASDEDFKRRHARVSLVTCVIFSDFTVGEGIEFKRLHDALSRNPLFKSQGDFDKEAALEAVDMELQVDPYVKSALVEASLKIEQDLQTRDISAAEWEKRLQAYVGRSWCAGNDTVQISSQDIRAFVTAKMKLLNPEATQAHTDLFETGLREGRDIRAAMRFADEAVFQQFERETLFVREDPSLIEVKEQIRRLTGETADKFAELLRKNSEPLHEPDVQECVRQFYRLHKRCPSKDSGPLSGMPHVTWGQVAIYVRAGERGLSKHNCLRSFCYRVLDKDWLRPYEIEWRLENDPSRPWFPQYKTFDDRIRSIHKDMPNYREISASISLFGADFVRVLEPTLAKTLGTKKNLVQFGKRKGHLSRFKEIVLSVIDSGSDISTAEIKKLFSAHTEDVTHV